MKADLLSKLLQVIEQIPKDVLYDFCCSYAQEHEELAMALVNEFCFSEKVNIYRMLTSDSSRWCLRTFWGYTSKLAANDSFVNN
jgi:hypothetical protein